MVITLDELQIIHECTKDEESFHRIVALLDERRAEPKQHFWAEAGAKLQLDEAQVKLMLDIMNVMLVPIYIKDRNSRFVLANQPTWAELGVPDSKSLIGKTDFDFAAKAEAQEYFDAEQEVIRTGQPLLNFELFVPPERGGPRWYLVTKAAIRNHQGYITGLLGINRNITQQKLAEIALAEERNILRTIIDHIPDKIYIKDRQSRFVLANRRTLEAQQLACMEELIGTTDFDYMKPDRAQEHMDGEQALMRTGQPIINQELFVPEYLRGPLWFLVTKVPVYDDDGNVTGLVGINRDITKRRLAEQKALELALESERSRILADFITDASHEFRTAVTIIQSSAYVLKNTTDVEKQQRHITHIVDALTDLLRLIDNLISMSRLDSITAIDLQAMRLRDVLQVVVERCDSQAQEKGLVIEVIVDDTLQPVHGDEEKLDRAFSCILNNAIRYTPTGGKVTICSCAQDDKVIVEISDTGIGMTSEIQRNIFKRFYRVDDAHTTSGFGLGLSIAQRIVELHRGRIEVDSKPNQGSTFRIILPKSP